MAFCFISASVLALGVWDAQDWDSDNDFIADLVETAQDFDSDNLPNYHDSDSDNDGLADTLERTEVVFKMTPLGEGDYYISASGRLASYSTSSNGEGVRTPGDCAARCAAYGNSCLAIGWSAANIDGTCAGTYCCNLYSSTSNSITWNVKDNDFLWFAVSHSLTDDADGDGWRNSVDLDADGDGIYDSLEGAGDPDSDSMPSNQVRSKVACWIAFRAF